MKDRLEWETLMELGEENRLKKSLRKPKDYKERQNKLPKKRKKRPKENKRRLN